MDEVALNAITDADTLRALVREQMAKVLQETIGNIHTGAGETTNAHT